MKGLLRKGTILLMILTLLLSMVPASFAEEGNETTAKITVLATSDLHGRIYPHDYATDSKDDDAGMALIQTLVKQEKANNPNTVLIDCGDTVQDNMAELFNNEAVHPMIEGLNYMEYDTWTLGNHEFNFGLDFLNKNIDNFNGAVLAANIYKEDGSRFVKPYTIIEKNGIRIAIVGMMPPHVPTWEASTPDHFKGLTFTDPVEEAKKVVTELNGKYDVLIGAFHLGDTPEYLETDGAVPIAEACPEFDVIFTGHKHSQFDDKEVNGVKLLEPGKYGAALGKAEIELEKSGDKWAVKDVTLKNLSTKGITADQELLDKFAYVHEKSLFEANKVVGEITEDFIKRPDYIMGSDTITTMPTAQIEDTAVIDLINEVQMFYADAEISSAALFNFGSNLKKGPFKKKDVAFIYMYDNTLMGVNITGENLKKYMEWSASYYNTYKEGDITVSFNPEIRGYNYDMFSGVNYEIDITQPKGNRIENLTFNGKSIENDKVYKLAVNNYRFGTLISLGLVTLEDKYFDSYKKYQDAGRVRDLIIKYVQEEKGGKLAPTVDNNWKLVGLNINSSYQDKVFEMVRNGELSIPKSEDGRTMNIKALNAHELIAAGKLQPVENSKYSVKAGDVLWKIAKQFKTTWEKLAEINNLKNPHMIYPGQQLIVSEE